MHRWNDIGQCLNRGCAAHPGEDVHCPCPRQTGPSAQLAAAREAAATPIHVYIYDYSAQAVNVQHLRVALAEVDRITSCVAEFLTWMDRYGLGSDIIDLGPPVRRLRQGVLSPRGQGVLSPRGQGVLSPREDIPGKCPDCGSTALVWSSAIFGPHGIADGRHCIAELTVWVFLGCTECSCTVYHEPLDAFLARVMSK